MTAKYLLFLGRIWADLENRGEDLSLLRPGLAKSICLSLDQV